MAKRSIFTVFCLAVVMILVFSVNIGIAGEINGEEFFDIEEDAYAASCWISDTCGGPAITQVRESDGAERMYWLNYAPGATITFQKFIVKFKSSDTVLKKQVQNFKFPSGYSGNTCTPFGVPYWGGDVIIGPAQLKVKSDVGTCTYDFEVIK